MPPSGKIPKTINSTKTDAEYYELADNDAHWQVVCASARLDGIELTSLDDLLAGKRVAGDITLNEWIDAVVKDSHGRIT